MLRHANKRFYFIIIIINFVNLLGNQYFSHEYVSQAIPEDSVYLKTKPATFLVTN